ncbi:shikimate kinase [Salipaludibacillus sp. CF4.18]|uniref:shikimate kinase n=1 Tax=Salipaludibacillus sp. CF4.18 TaxID=3373081 RepID=UPI003EE50C6C
MMNRGLSFRQKNIIFIGFMGVGKTSVGKLVAEKLYRGFIDVDQEIEKEFEMSVPEIFKEHGEKVFRDKEKQLTIDYCNQRLKVISVGGGAFKQKEIRDICLSSSIVFFLDMSWESWKERINILIDNRPILQGLSQNEMKDLFYERQGMYNLHHSRYNTDQQSVEEVADYIIESLKLAWQLHEPDWD